MSDDNPQVIIIAGPNGAGKTTLAPFLLRDGLGVMEYVNADPIARGLSGFDMRSVAFEAGRIMLRRIHELAERERHSPSKPRCPGNPMPHGFAGSKTAAIGFNCFFYGVELPNWRSNECANESVMGVMTLLNM